MSELCMQLFSKVSAMRLECDACHFEEVISNAFSCRRSFVFKFKFHLILFPWAQLIIICFTYGWGLPSNKQQCNILTDVTNISRTILAYLCCNEFQTVSLQEAGLFHYILLWLLCLLYGVSFASCQLCLWFLFCLSFYSFSQFLMGS